MFDNGEPTTILFDNRYSVIKPDGQNALNPIFITVDENGQKVDCLQFKYAFKQNVNIEDYSPNIISATENEDKTNWNRSKYYGVGKPHVVVSRIGTDMCAAQVSFPTVYLYVRDGWKTTNHDGEYLLNGGIHQLGVLKGE